MEVTLIYFYSYGSGPCRIQDFFIDSLESEFERKVDFKRIDVDNDKEVAKKYYVDEVPTIIIEYNGEEKERFKGLTQELFLKRAIEKVLLTT